MHNYYQTKIKYEKTLEEGRIKKVTELYLVDALSFTEAEARIIEEMRPFISGEFTVSRIVPKKINEMFFNEDGDKWYQAKVNFVTLDQEKGIEKRTAITMFAQASDNVDADKIIREGMKGCMVDYEIASITETKILDVFKYNVE